MTRTKLGLALAGGGFRASLFHVGVLRRMADMDLLRYVQILSTVSGGSIVGALYILLLKRRLEDPQYEALGPDKLHLPQREYQAIVDELQTALVAGIRKNLRTRLLMNPWTVIKVMFWKNSLAAEMGRLYEKHIFGAAIAELRKLDPNVVDRSGRIPLTAIRLRQAQVSQHGGTAHYNALALDPARDERRGGPGSAATRLILNATSLNSGARFWFSHTEVGDWYLGHVRRDEIDTELLPRKLLRDLPPNERQALIDVWPDAALRNLRWHKLAEAYLAKHLGVDWAGERGSALMAWSRDPQRRVQIEFVHWLRYFERERAIAATRTRCFKRRKGTRHGGLAPDTPVPLPWHGPLDAGEFRALVDALLEADAGRLRHAKNYAWYLSEGRKRETPVNAGMDDDTLWKLFWDVLESIDEKHALKLEQAFNGQRSGAGRAGEPRWCDQLFAAVLEVYFCQTAAAISPKIRDEWDALPLADAVAASAAFPPVFPPYQLSDLYDDMHVQVLSLTDGGPFDNLGVTALMDEHCNHVIASDTGALFNTRQSKSAVGRWGLMRRLSDLLMNRPAQLYRHELNERRRLGRAIAADATLGAAGERELVAHIHAELDACGHLEMAYLLEEDRTPAAAASAGTGQPMRNIPSAISQFASSRALNGLASFHIGSPRLSNDAPPIVDPALIANLRTDLDVFGDAEIKCLVNEGYVIADQYLRAGLKNTACDPAARTPGAAGWTPVDRGPLPIGLETPWLETILRAGKQRAFRALRLRAWPSVVVTALAVVGPVAAVFYWNWDWASLYSAFSTAMNWLVASVLYMDFLHAVARVLPFKYALLAVLVLAVVWLSGKECFRSISSRFVQWMRREYAGYWRGVLMAWKFAKILKFNLLWIFKALPLAVFLVPPIALVSHYLFAKPFQRKTRDSGGLSTPKPLN